MVLISPFLHMKVVTKAHYEVSKKLTYSSAKGCFGVHIKYMYVFTYTLKKWWACKSLAAIPYRVIGIGA